MSKPTARELLRSLAVDDSERTWLTSLQDDDHMVSIDHKDERVLAGQCLDASMLAARVERVLALHGGSINLRNGKPYEYCPECSEDSPCPTVRALDGEE